jgi:hypothetical protein
LNNINDELFKDYLYFIDNFTLERLIHKNAEEFKQALINLLAAKKEMNLNDYEYLFQIICKSHETSLKSSIDLYKELIFDYHTWLVGNYEIVPLSPEVRK